MADVLWHPRARADLLAIADYISDDNPDAAMRLLQEVMEKAEHLRDFPLMGRTGRVDGTRELVVCAQYVLVYRVSDDNATMTVLRVLHAARQWPPRKGD